MTTPETPELQRLVIEYGIGDGFTYHFRQHKPVQYSSAEAFAVEFEEACRAQSDASTLIFAGVSFPVDSFFDDGTYFGPEIMTVDEWFAGASR